MIEAILELLAGGGEERDLNRQIYQDALHLVAPDPSSPFHTRTARRLAEEKGS